MKALFRPLLDRVFVLGRILGPYAAIELMLPGGSMVALLYWWYRRRITRAHAHSDGKPSSAALYAVRSQSYCTNATTGEDRPVPRDQLRARPGGSSYAEAA